MITQKVLSRSAEFYLKNGYIVFPKVFSHYLCNRIVAEGERMKQLSGFLSQSNQKQQRTHTKSQYFVENNKVSEFFENTSPTEDLNPEAVIKIGHSLHKKQFFEEFFDDKTMKEILSEVGILDPIIIQSMILEKLPMKGGKITMHQDSTYLTCEPDTITACWVPLEDVTKKNGCIWVLPGSQASELYCRHRMIDGKPLFEVNRPFDYNEKDCIPLEMKKGDLLLLNGKILHKSNDNESKKSRYAYLWHLMNANSKWSPENWLTWNEIIGNQKNHQH